MAAIRLSRLRSVCAYGRFVNLIDVRPSSVFMNRNYHAGESGFKSSNNSNGLRTMALESTVDNCYGRGMNVTAVGFGLSHVALRGSARLCGGGPMMNYRSYSSVVSGPEGKPEVPLASSGDGGGFGGSDWPDKVKEVWKSTVDAVTNAGEKAKEVSSEVTPQFQQLIDAHPYLKDVVLPVGGTLVGTFLAWKVLPRILRRFHTYASQGAAAISSESSLRGPVPYENSFWGALEDPVRYLVTFMTFSQIGVMIAPTTIAAQYISPAWKGGVILSFVWFLNRWKSNVISRALDNKSQVDRDKLLTLDRVSSVGLFALGFMGLVEACGVAVQSILTVGGIGGVATAFAARDVLGNVLSGLSVQISRPFSVGDTIKAGSVEGQVIEMGLTTTSLLTTEKFPAIVPNSLFSSQVIVNKSRAHWRSFVTQLPLQINNFDVIPNITDDIKTMLRSNPNVFLDREAPYCYLSGVARSFAELNIGCNLKYMGGEQLLSAQQEIILQSAKIIKEHGATLGSYSEHTNH